MQAIITAAGITLDLATAEEGVSIRLSAEAAAALQEQLGDMPSKGRPAVRQLHRDIEAALALLSTRMNGTEGG